jgi:phenylpyruvate tautomerase PptA (4-oxalocrotonate tautomerase family)
MPLIRCEFPEGITPDQQDRLGKEITEAVMASIGCTRQHIYVSIKQTPVSGLIEAGRTPKAMHEA